MGMTRAVGFGFLLLLIVTHASGEANIRQTTVSDLLSNEHYLVLDGVKETTISNAEIGDKVVLVVDGPAEGLDWVAFGSPAGQSLVGLFKTFRKSSDEGNLLISQEIILTQTGEHKFQIKRGGNSNKVTFTVSQGSRYILEPFMLSEVELSVVSTPGRELSFVFRGVPNDSEWTLESSPGLTTSEVEPSPYEDILYYRSVRVTPTEAGSYRLSINSIKASNAPFKAFIINITAET